MNTLLLIILTVVSWMFIFSLLRSNNEEGEGEVLLDGREFTVGGYVDLVRDGYLVGHTEIVRPLDATAIGVKHADAYPDPLFVTVWDSYGQGQRSLGAGDELPGGDRPDGE